MEAYQQLLKSEEITDKSLSDLTSTSQGYNDWRNTFLGNKLLVSDKQLEDAFVRAESTMKDL